MSLDVSQVIEEGKKDGEDKEETKGSDRSIIETNKTDSNHSGGSKRSKSKHRYDRTHDESSQELVRGGGGGEGLWTAQPQPRPVQFRKDLN